MTTLRSAKIEAALELALAGRGTAALLDQLERSSGLPGPRPNFDLARALGLAIAGHGRKADLLLRDLQRAPDEYPRVVAAAAFAARRVAKIDPAGAMASLKDIADDPRHHVRGGVIEALRTIIGEIGDEAFGDLASFMDGYLQAHAALEAISERTLLTRIKAGAGALALLDDAFKLADASPRSAERSQGMRLLRGSLPAQITTIAGRYPEVLDWLLQRAEAKRPETREVVANTISVLRRSSLSDAAAARLSAALAGSAKPPRDPSRIVQGTRKRAKGRR